MQKIDWFTIISDLKKAGISGREIARRLGVSVSTVVMLKKGHHQVMKKGLS